MWLFDKIFKKQQNIDPDENQGSLSLIFHCTVQSGEGRFNRMVFPGRSALATASPEWPEELARGSLNCRVTKFPKNLYAYAGQGDRIQSLDSGLFIPEFTIPRDAIQNNRVGPRNAGDDPRMGMAQAWRCAVRNENTGETFSAWHVRRVDGTYPPFHGVIELMADRKLRDAHGLSDGTPLTIQMFCKAEI